LPGNDREEVIWEDLKKVQKKIIQEKQSSQTMSGGQVTNTHGTIPTTAKVSRLDVISRKLFGLLAYLDREQTFDTRGTYATIKAVAGDERYNNLIHTIEPVKNELILEAELFFGKTTETDAEKSTSDSTKIQKDIAELLLNFEEDIVREDFAKTMAELTRLEKDAGTGFNAAAEELMKKCQVLSLRVAELAKKRHH
jgi:hypothetical protein